MTSPVVEKNGRLILVNGRIIAGCEKVKGIKKLFFLIQLNINRTIIYSKQ